jgi:dTDP-4-amino-4,6-dideoxygalactose transaminase
VTSPVPFFALDREYGELREPLLAAIDAALATGQMLQGEQVAQLEQELAVRAGRRHAVAVNSCTDALYFALTVAGIGPGDEVIVPDYTFAATVSAVLRTGATPVLVDIDENFGLDLELAETAVTPSTTAIVYAHLYGGMGPIEEIESFAARHGIALIEDAAQALGASHDGRAAGSLGLASCYSFDPTKVVGALGSGGAVLTDDDDLAHSVSSLRVHGREGPRFARLGFNSQLSTIAAAALLVKLEAEERWLTRRREIARSYIESLDADGVQVPRAGAHRDHVFHKFVVRTSARAALAAALEEQGVQTMIHYPYCIHQLEFFGTRPHRVVTNGAAAAATEEVLSLPIHPHLRDDEVARVIDAAHAFRSRLDPVEIT